MKKIISLGQLVLVLGLILSSCKKEELETIPLTIVAQYRH